MTDLAEWPALVLTAGLATRLQPLSGVRAKAALPVAGATLIRRLLVRLRDAGVRRVVLNLHHRPETITREVGDGSDLGLQVRYSWESPVLGSAGGPRRALPLLDADRFLILNGDTLTNVDLRAVAGQHTASGAQVTMAVVPGDVARYGGVVVEPDGRVAGFVRGADAARETRAVYHFIGVQAVDARAFGEAPDDTPSETVRWLYPRLIAASPGAVRAHVSDAEFHDIGTPADYHRTTLHIAAREARGLDIGARVRVDASARLTRTLVWDDVTIGAGAELTDCIVADGVDVPAGARYERAVLVGDGPVQATPF